MYRKYDFMSMEVYNLKGKHMGTISDISFDFNKLVVEGFEVESTVLFKKADFVSRRDIVYFNDNLIAREMVEKTGVPLKQVYNMDIYNLDGEIIGIISDVIIDEELNLIGFVVSSGILKDVFDGRRIISVKNIIVGDENVIYHGGEKIIFKNLIHL